MTSRRDPEYYPRDTQLFSMRFTVLPETLTMALAVLCRAVVAKPELPAEKRLYMRLFYGVLLMQTTTHNNTVITSQTPVGMEIGGIVAVPARQMQDAIKALVQSEPAQISMERVNEAPHFRDTLVIRQGNTVASVPVEDHKRFPFIAPAESQAIALTDAERLKATCTYAAEADTSTRETRYSEIATKDGEIMAQHNDGYRWHRASTQASIQQEASARIERQALKLISQVLPGKPGRGKPAQTVYISQRERQLELSWSCFTLTTATTTGVNNLPTYPRPHLKLIASKEALMIAIKRAHIINKDYMQVVIKPGEQVSIQASSQEIGDTQTEIKPMPGSEIEPTRFDIDPDYLRDTISKIEATGIVISFSQAWEPVWIEAEKQGAVKCSALVMKMQPKEDRPPASKTPVEADYICPDNAPWEPFDTIEYKPKPRQPQAPRQTGIDALRLRAPASAAALAILAIMVIH